MQILFPVLWRMERAPVADYLIGAYQKIPDFLQIAKTAIRLSPSLVIWSK